MHRRLIMTLAVAASLLAPATTFAQTSDMVMSPMAGAVPTYVLQRDDPVTLANGKVAAGQVIMAVPFAYRYPVRTKDGFRSALDHIPAGSPGFDAGVFRGPLGYLHMICFFNRQADKPFADPLCIRQAQDSGEWNRDYDFTSYMAADTDGNLPYSGQPGFLLSAQVQVEPLDHIDHDFRLNLIVKKWAKDGAHVKWLSDGVVVENATYNLNSQGNVVFAVNGGTLTLSPDTSDKTATMVAFTPDTGIKPGPQGRD